MSRDNLPSTNLRRCEITGEKFPPDQIIYFRGRWVGARGKQILLDRLRSGEGPGPEFIPPKMFQRAKAFCFDWAALFALATMGAYCLPFTLVILLEFVIFTAAFGYQIGQTGQTWSTRLAGIRIISRTGEPPGVMRGVIRTALYFLPLLLIYLIMAGYTILPPARLSVVWAIALVVYLPVNIVCLLLDSSQRRAFYDLLAGTRPVAEPGSDDEPDCDDDPDDENEPEDFEDE
ncbi:MAG: RDD family protein [Phycisphaerae bacterium]